MIVDVFTNGIARTEFLKGLSTVPKRPLKYEQFTTEVSSTARIETYAWMHPGPRISRYLGHRRFAQPDLAIIPVANVEYDGGLSVPLRDIEDDQIGGYPLMFRDLGQQANLFPGVAVIQALAAGESNVAFDGTNYFATTHGLGSGNSTLPAPFTGGTNLLNYTSAASADGVVYKAAFLLHSESLVKPILWQRRKGPKLDNDAGSPTSRLNKQVNYWVDLEGAAFYGYWWDAVLVKITNTPSLSDIFLITDRVMTQFFSFTLPKALPTDAELFVHQGLEFSAETGTIVCHPGLWSLFNHALNEDRVGVSVAGSTSGITSNIYRGAWGLVASGYMV